MSLFTEWLRVSGLCDQVTSSLLSLLLWKAWWVRPSGRSISLPAAAPLSPPWMWRPRRLDLTPVWPLWPHWATTSMDTSPSLSTIMDTQVNVATGSSLGGIPAALRLVCLCCFTRQRSLHAMPALRGFSGLVSVSVSCGWAPRLDGPVGVDVALHSSADAPPLGERGPEPRGQRTHHQRAECRCRGAFEHRSLRHQGFHPTGACYRDTHQLETAQKYTFKPIQVRQNMAELHSYNLKHISISSW